MAAEQTLLDTFAADVEQGLTSSPKVLPSKYFYDAEGDRLFQQIMDMPEYYLTGCEFEILDQQNELLLEAFTGEERLFSLIELGAGDGYKTERLLRHFMNKKVPFRYIPNDISPNVLEELTLSLSEKYPSLEMAPVAGDYFQVMNEVGEQAEGRKVVLFLGGNIGNYAPEEASHFLSKLWGSLAPGDRLMIGFDLKKEPFRVLKAYNDPYGITAKFNLNLLERINRELGGTFDAGGFLHTPVYDPLAGEARSYLVSRKEQEVWVEALERTIGFEAWEAIFTERSRKFSLSGIEELARENGFEVIRHLQDSKGYFVDSVWRRV